MDTRESLPDRAKSLGAHELEAKEFHVGVFVPSEKRNGEPVDHEYWRDEAVRTMSRLFGGATVADGFGGWWDEEAKCVQEEAISIVFSFITRDEWNTSNLETLRKFLHRMGRDAEQGEIGILTNGVFRRIRRFDDE